MNRFLNSVVSWLRAGYPSGVPENDYLPILALLKRRLTTDEVIMIARELQDLSAPDFADIGAEIMRITDELPAPADVDRVREKLAAHGWPQDDPRDTEDAEYPPSARWRFHGSRQRCPCSPHWRGYSTDATVRWFPSRPAICAKVTC